MTSNRKKNIYEEQKRYIKEIKKQKEASQKNVSRKKVFYRFLRGTSIKTVIGLVLSVFLGIFLSGLTRKDTFGDWYFIGVLIIAAFFLVIGSLKDFKDNSALARAYSRYFSGTDEDLVNYKFNFWHWGEAGEFVMAGIVMILISIAGSKLYVLFF